MTKKLFNIKYITLSLIIFTISCGTTSQRESSLIEVDEIADQIQSSADTLLPEINQTEIAALRLDFEGWASQVAALTYLESDDWSAYLTESTAYVLSDIFGSAEEEPAGITKLRVLLEQSHELITDIVTQDPSLNCTGGETLSTSDFVTVAFFGDLANGTSTNPYLKCLTQDESTTTLYGMDNDSIFRLVSMTDLLSANSENISVRGDQKYLRTVSYITYGLRTESSELFSYVDLQYAQATSYNGIDDIFDTADDKWFRSRSRITGRVSFNSEGVPTAGAGEFAVTKNDTYDEGVGTVFTQTYGRGYYGVSRASLFKISSDERDLEDHAGTFCIQEPASGGRLPSVVSSDLCSPYETAFPWSTTTFPFTVTPALNPTFESNSFFGTADLIELDGSNFAIPSYR